MKEAEAFRVWRDRHEENRFTFTSEEAEAWEPLARGRADTAWDEYVAAERELERLRAAEEEVCRGTTRKERLFGPLSREQAEAIHKFHLQRASMPELWKRVLKAETWWLGIANAVPSYWLTHGWTGK